MTPSDLSLDEFLHDAEAWLDAHLERRPRTEERRWGEGEVDVSIFQNLTPAAEREVAAETRAWQRTKSDAGYGSISWPEEYGGAGLPRAYEEAFRRLERQFVTPTMHEAIGLSMNIEAPTIRALGTDAQRARYVAALRRTDQVCCQLFSEPGAGSDLGSISMRAEWSGESWIVNGQKLWTTGAHFADIGYVIARTSATGARQTALTAFVVAMDLPGIDVRPLRQMTGGASFNEVFFSDVTVPDDARLGEVGAGWQAMMTTLGFERSAGAGGPSTGSSEMFERLVQLARHLGRDGDPIIRQELARAYADAKARTLTVRRAAGRARAGGVPGPEGSIGKLAFTNGLRHLGEIAAMLLGPSLSANSGAWGTYEWTELVTGTPGLRIAGGTDEIQRNTIAERVLGLPREPR